MPAVIGRAARTGVGAISRVQTSTGCAVGRTGATVSAVKLCRRRALEYFVGLDVSIDETAICIVEEKGVLYRWRAS